MPDNKKKRFGGITGFLEDNLFSQKPPQTPLLAQPSLDVQGPPQTGTPLLPGMQSQIVPGAPPPQRVGGPGQRAPATTTGATPSSAATATGGKTSPRGRLTDAELDAFQEQIESSVFSGSGTFPKGALRYDEDGLTPESEELLKYWNALRTSQATQRQQQQTFLTSLLTNPSAMAAFQLMRGQGQQPFQGGFSGLPQGQLSGAASRFGFNPYETVNTQPEGVETEPGLETGLERQTRLRPIGSPTGSFFQGGVPTLGSLGGPQNQDLQGLLGMLALFGINPQEFQQQSAMVTPRPVSAGGSRVALAAGRR